MNTNIHENDHDDALRWQLRGLRRDIEPGRDLWPDISARIAQAPTQAAKAQRKRPTWLPMAMAASLLLAFGVFWHLNPTPPAASSPSAGSTVAASGDPLIRHEAAALSWQYQGAFVELARSEPTSTDRAYAAALRDLDHSAAQIRAAIERSPDSRFLLEQLHRTYARRLALTQRATLT